MGDLWGPMAGAAGVGGWRLMAEAAGVGGWGLGKVALVLVAWRPSIVGVGFNPRKIVKMPGVALATEWFSTVADATWNKYAATVG